MSSALLLKIKEDMKSAMRAHEAQLLLTIRLLLAAIKQREVDERIELTDAQIISIVDKMIRQRLDSIEQYQKGNRPELAEKENAEIAILKKYLPLPLSDEEITVIINQAISSINARSIKDMSKVMSHIKDKVQGRADMGKISAIIKSILETQG